MKLKVKILKFLAGRPVCMIHEKTAEEMSLHIENRVILKKRKKRIISIVNITLNIIKPKEIAVSNVVIKRLKLKTGDVIDVEITEPPKSINFIKKKLKGRELEKQEIKEIIQDISNNALREAEIAFFITALNSEGMSLTEIKYLIQAMVETGKQLKLRGKVVDKHCIGGIAGNRTTPLVVAICGAAGLIMPKTSSRAITSAAGTVDVVETIAKVDFSLKQIKQIIKKTGACMVWGGALGLAPVDDKIIKIEKIVKVDSDAQLLASILSKKISVDSNYILIDIPYGKSAKVTKRKAEKLKTKFLNLGRKFDLKVQVVLTDGREPIGNSVGPILEIIDILKILQNKPDAPKDLKDKSIMLAGKLLEMSGKAKTNQGIKMATQIIESGKAYEKFEQIIKAQQGAINKSKLKLGKYTHIVYSKSNRKIKSYDNKLINSLARNAGCPEDKSAGIYFHKKANQSISKGDKIMTIYSQSKEKLEHAVKFLTKNKKMMIGHK